MKVCSISCVVGYGFALSFGFLAITGAAVDPAQNAMINELMAAAGFGLGTLSWLRIRRGC